MLIFVIIITFINKKYCHKILLIYYFLLPLQQIKTVLIFNYYTMRKKYIKIPIEKLLDRYTVTNNNDTKTVKEILKQHNVSEWYKDTFTTDSLAININTKLTFYDIFEGLVNRRDFYNMIGISDSLIRERIFRGLAELMSVDYDIIYYLWL